MMKVSKLENTTIMAIRACIAVTIAVIVGSIFQLEHFVWAIFIALLITAQSAGESIKNGLIRLGMTVVGCSIGWGLAILLQHSPWLMLIVTYVFLFLLTGFMFTVFTYAMLFLGIVVALLFSIIGAWTEALWLARIYETAIGCGIGVIVSLTIFPKQARTELKPALLSLVQQFHQLFQQAVNKTLHTKNSGSILFLDEIYNVVSQIYNLKTLIYHASFEGFAFFSEWRKNRELITTLFLINENIAHLIEVLPIVHNQAILEFLEPILMEISQQINQQFMVLQKHLRKETCETLPEWNAYHENTKQALAQLKGQPFVSEMEFMDIVALFYYARRIDHLLRKLSESV